MSSSSKFLGGTEAIKTSSLKNLFQGHFCTRWSYFPVKVFFLLSVRASFVSAANHASSSPRLFVPCSFGSLRSWLPKRSKLPSKLRRIYQNEGKLALFWSSIRSDFLSTVVLMELLTSEVTSAIHTELKTNLIVTLSFKLSFSMQPTLLVTTKEAVIIVWTQRFVNSSTLVRANYFQSCGRITTDPVQGGWTVYRANNETIWLVVQNRNFVDDANLRVAFRYLISHSLFSPIHIC